MTEFQDGDIVKVVIQGKVDVASGCDEYSTPIMVVEGHQILKDSPEVTIELVERPAVWTDGDIVRESKDSRVWWRDGGRWHYAKGRGTATDAAINTDVNNGQLVVVRKQQF